MLFLLFFFSVYFDVVVVSSSQVVASCELPMASRERRAHLKRRPPEASARMNLRLAPSVATGVARSQLANTATPFQTKHQFGRAVAGLTCNRVCCGEKSSSDAASAAIELTCQQRADIASASGKFSNCDSRSLASCLDLLALLEQNWLTWLARLTFWCHFD